MNKFKQLLMVVFGAFLLGAVGCKSIDMNSGYVVKVESFSPEAQEIIEDSLMAMDGYRDLRISVATHLHKEYWYSTTAGSAYVLRELNRTLSQNNLKGKVRYGGNTFSVKATVLRSM